jgi:DNA-binding transcriptional LysR family regulator
LQKILVSCKNRTRCCKNMPTTLLPLMASFAVVVKAGSFTRAAARLNLSKSVVSRHVSALEKELGVQLMYRSTHRLSLTEAGEHFYSYCKGLEDVAEQAVAAATAAREQPKGLLRLTLPQTVIVSPVGSLITRFQSDYPDVHLDVRVTSLQVDPIEEGFDLALRIGTLHDSSLTCRKICDVRFIVVAAPSYLERHGTPRTDKELRQHNCLSFSEFGSRLRMQVEPDAARRKAPTPSGTLNTNSGILLMNALLAGQGIVVGPDLMFEPHIRRGAVRAVLDKPGTEPSGLYAVFPPGRFPAPGRTAFVDYLIAGLRS